MSRGQKIKEGIGDLGFLRFLNKRKFLIEVIAYFTFYVWSDCT